VGGKVSNRRVQAGQYALRPGQAAHHKLVGATHTRGSDLSALGGLDLGLDEVGPVLHAQCGVREARQEAFGNSGVGLF
jgi:hypothetical protein